MKTLYTAHATVIAGRTGSAKTDDNRLSVKLTSPNKNDEGTNPEQLFACAYGACFGSAVSAVAKKENTAIEEIKVQPDVSLNEDENGYLIGVVLNVTLAGIAQPIAEKIVKGAHLMCPYSKAIKNNVEVKLIVNGKEIAKQ